MRGKTNELTGDHFQDQNSKGCHMDDIDTEKRKRTLQKKESNTEHPFQIERRNRWTQELTEK